MYPVAAHTHQRVSGSGLFFVNPAQDAEQDVTHATSPRVFWNKTTIDTNNLSGIPSF